MQSGRQILRWFVQLRTLRTVVCSSFWKWRWKRSKDSVGLCERKSGGRERERSDNIARDQLWISCALECGISSVSNGKLDGTKRDTSWRIEACVGLFLHDFVKARSEKERNCWFPRSLDCTHRCHPRTLHLWWFHLSGWNPRAGFDSWLQKVEQDAQPQSLALRIWVLIRSKQCKSWWAARINARLPPIHPTQNRDYPL